MKIAYGVLRLKPKGPLADVLMGDSIHDDDDDKKESKDQQEDYTNSERCIPTILAHREIEKREKEIGITQLLIKEAEGVHELDEQKVLAEIKAEIGSGQVIIRKLDGSRHGSCARISKSNMTRNGHIHMSLYMRKRLQ